MEHPIQFYIGYFFKTGGLHTNINNFIMFKRKSTTTRGTRKGVVRKRRGVVGSGLNRYRMVRTTLPKTFPGGDEHRTMFRRGLPDVSLFVDSGANIVALNSFGVNPGWITLGSGTSDNPSAGSSPLAQFGAACTFSLANLVNHTELTALYNEYQIRKVELRFSLDCAQSFTPNTWTTPNSLPSVYIADDPNDATVPPDNALLQQRGDFQQYELRPERSFVVALYPRAATQLFSTAVSTSYSYPSNSAMNWIDCSPPSDSTPHYGLKMWFRNFCGAAGSGMCVRIQPVMHVVMRRTR